MPKFESRDATRSNYEERAASSVNADARALFDSNPPALDDVQRRVLADMRTDGCATVHISQLFSPQVWEALQEEIAPWTRHMEDFVASGRAVIKQKPGQPVKEKFYMGRRYKKQSIESSSPWFSLAVSRNMLDIVNSYMGLCSNVSHIDQWYTPAAGDGAGRAGSQRWHRDFDDRHLVKVFIYLVDVDLDNGPFEYVPGSTGGGEYSHLWPWRPLGEDTYPPQDQFGELVPPEAVRTFTAPAGTMIFCDTTGFHRGGHATLRPRNLFVYNYLSPASLGTLVQRNFDPVISVEMDEIQRAALQDRTPTPQRVNRPLSTDMIEIGAPIFSDNR